MKKIKVNDFVEDEEINVIDSGNMNKVNKYDVGFEEV